jgi:hypothetical protein
MSPRPKVVRVDPEQYMHRPVRTRRSSVPVTAWRESESSMSIPGFTASCSFTAVSPRVDHALGRGKRRYRQPLAVAQVDWPNEFYGNWCGPGHSGPGVPIDAVDEVCCRHDQCFCVEGWDDCACNRQAALRMPEAMTDSSTSAEGAAIGGAIAVALLAAPCLCHEIFTLFWGWEESPIPLPSVGGICPFPWR